MGATGTTGVHEVQTDMLLLTKLAGIPLGPGPSAVDESLDGLISRKMERAKFKGDLGKFILIEVDQKAYPDCPQRYILLVGLGSPQKFSSQTVCSVFQLVVDKALELGVEHVTIPFAPNRMTVSSLNMKGMAHLLKEVVETRMAALKGDPELKRIQLLCSPQARKHIKAGLDIPSRHSRTCCIHVPDEK
jgi:hypothetical protein